MILILSHIFPFLFTVRMNSFVEARGSGGNFNPNLEDAPGPTVICGFLSTMKNSSEVPRIKSQESLEVL